MVKDLVWQPQKRKFDFVLGRVDGGGSRGPHGLLFKDRPTRAEDGQTMPRMRLICTYSLRAQPGFAPGPTAKPPGCRLPALPPFHQGPSLPLGF